MSMLRGTVNTLLVEGEGPPGSGSSPDKNKAPGSVKARPQWTGRTSVLMELKPPPLVPRLRPQPSESGRDAGCLGGRPRAASPQHCCRLGKAVNLRVPPYLQGNTRKNRGKAESSRRGLGLSEVTTLPLDGDQLWGLDKCSSAGTLTQAGPPYSTQPAAHWWGPDEALSSCPVVPGKILWVVGR